MAPDQHELDLTAGQVGGRHDSTPPPALGGGYQNIYTKTGAAVPAGVDKLRRIGVASIWVDLAKKVGIDTCLQIWHIMDSHHTLDIDRRIAHSHRGEFRIAVPILNTTKPLAQIWIDIAYEIGFQTFLKAWRLMDGHKSLDRRRRMIVPMYRVLKRYERNEFTRSLIAAGWSDASIISEVKRVFGEVLGRRTLLRLRTPRKITA